MGLLGSRSDETLIAQILGSPEYFASRGNSSTDSFLTALYCDGLSRSIDSPAQSGDESALSSGVPRSVIASGVLGSSEYRSLAIHRIYLRYLRRAPTSSDLATWATFIQSGGSDEQMIAAIVSSPEYFAHVNPTPAVSTTLLVHGNVLTTTVSRDAALTLTVLRILPAGHVAKCSSPPRARRCSASSASGFTTRAA